MKRIEYIAPIDWMSGNLSGRQMIKYSNAGAKAYDLSVGERATAVGYQPRLIARRMYQKRRNFYQVRTKTSVNMSSAYRTSIALMGGAAAMFAAIMSDKASAIYAAVLAAKAKEQSMRAYLIPILRKGLENKDEQIAIAPETYVTNPWQYTGTQNIDVSAAIVSKFTDVLSN